MEHARFISYDYPEEKAAIREMLDALRASLSSLDPKRIEAHHLYGDKFTGVHDGVRQGAEAQRQREASFFGSIDRFDCEFTDVRIDVFEHTALVTCVYEVDFEVGGQAKSDRVFLTFLLVNDGGRWKITHEGLFRLPEA